MIELSDKDKDNIVKVGKRIVSLLANDTTLISTDTIEQIYLSTYLYHILDNEGIVPDSNRYSEKSVSMVPEVYELRADDHCPPPWKPYPSRVMGLYDIFAHNKEIVARNLTKGEMYDLLRFVRP